MGRLRSKQLYDREFKLNALKLLEKGEVSMTQLAKDLGVNINTLSNWRKYRTKADAKISLFRYIEGFYNRGGFIQVWGTGPRKNLK